MIDFELTVPNLYFEIEFRGVFFENVEVSINI